MRMQGRPVMPKILATLPDPTLRALSAILAVAPEDRAALAANMRRQAERGRIPPFTPADIDRAADIATTAHTWTGL
jgi:hypothetical protein